MKIFSRVFEFNDNRIYYKISKPTKEKNNIHLIFIHGFLMNHDSWKYQWHFLGHDYNMIAIDIPPFGKSDIKDEQEPLTGELYQELISNLITYLNVANVVLIGHSFGGGLALLTYFSIKDKVRGLFLISPLYHKALSSNVLLNFFLNLLRISNSKFMQSIISYLPFNVLSSIFYLEPSFKVLSKTEKRFLFDIKILLNKQKNIYSMINILKNLPSWATTERHYNQIKIPIYLCWGEKDKILPIHVGKILENTLKNVHLITFQNLGHMPQIEYPDAMNKLVFNFLSELKPI